MGSSRIPSCVGSLLRLDVEAGGEGASLSPFESTVTATVFPSDLSMLVSQAVARGHEWASERSIGVIWTASRLNELIA